MVIDRKIRNIPNLIIDNYNFQKVTDFKYLETNTNNIYTIKLRTLTTNKEYFILEKII